MAATPAYQPLTAAQRAEKDMVRRIWGKPVDAQVDAAQAKDITATKTVIDMVPPVPDGARAAVEAYYTKTLGYGDEDDFQLSKDGRKMTLDWSKAALLGLGKLVDHDDDDDEEEEEEEEEEEKEKEGEKAEEVPAAPAQQKPRGRPRKDAKRMAGPTPWQQARQMARKIPLRSRTVQAPVPAPAAAAAPRPVIAGTACTYEGKAGGCKEKAIHMTTGRGGMVIRFCEKHRCKKCPKGQTPRSMMKKHDRCFSCMYGRDKKKAKQQQPPPAPPTRANPNPSKLKRKREEAEAEPERESKPTTKKQPCLVGGCGNPGIYPSRKGARDRYFCEAHRCKYCPPGDPPRKIRSGRTACYKCQLDGRHRDASDDEEDEEEEEEEISEPPAKKPRLEAQQKEKEVAKSTPTRGFPKCIVPGCKGRGVHLARGGKGGRYFCEDHRCKHCPADADARKVQLGSTRCYDCYMNDRGADDDDEEEESSSSSASASSSESDDEADDDSMELDSPATGKGTCVQPGCKNPGIHLTRGGTGDRYFCNEHRCRYCPPEATPRKVRNGRRRCAKCEQSKKDADSDDDEEVQDKGTCVQPGCTNPGVYETRRGPAGRYYCEDHRCKHCPPGSLPYKMRNGENKCDACSRHAEEEEEEEDDMTPPPMRKLMITIPHKADEIEKAQQKEKEREEEESESSIAIEVDPLPPVDDDDEHDEEEEDDEDNEEGMVLGEARLE